MKSIFRTDLCLVILFAASLLTGIKIHYANDFQTHDIWHTWSMIHFFVNIALLVTAIIHIKQHWGGGSRPCLRQAVLLLKAR